MSLFDRAYWLRIAQNPVVAAGLAIDLAPALMVVFAGWGAAALVMLYWVENLMIGVATIARILLTAIGRMGAPGLLFGGFITAFFALHYGLFCLGHGVFLLSFLPGLSDAAGLGDLSPTPHFMLNMVDVVLRRWPGMSAILALIGVWQVYVFIQDFWKGQEYARSEVVAEMFKPYGRIVVLHLGVFAGAAALMWVGDPMIGVLGLILLRAAFGLYANQRLGAAREGEGVAAGSATR